MDQGSPVFNEVVRSVPVLPQKGHALVGREIRKASLQSMIGRDVVDAGAEDPDHLDPPLSTRTKMLQTAGEDAATADAHLEKALVSAARKKRKLYKLFTGTERGAGVPARQRHRAPQRVVPRGGEAPLGVLRRACRGCGDARAQ